ncbi:DNA adenine methylase [Halorhabdus tiamatea]|uniref:site-specific DNA-methyltransferase (adenine-specific) n=1 Tax=Halorhabdus tiamatea SARL4B TaxID=1033806 RepID=F7PR46_9EURY|nr:Dam family site-specific DNA-(adenine-N6)-methyltransferase [Halorhabdus tiamatea]CCQ35035.1 DNA adenine methylase [Halorhabdus tiamatea SARL4B]
MAEPILKWAGGKRSMLDEILSRLPSNSQFNRYFEPFFGAGAVFFALQPTNGFINDINPRLINFYRQIKRNPEQIISQNKEFDAKYKQRREGEGDGSDFYYDKRDIFNGLREGPDKCKDPLREASLLLFLNRTCFNGLYRTNQEGDFNVPVGSKWTEVSVLERRIREAHRILQNTEITKKDFTFVRDHVEEGDLVFFDPPYPSVRKTGSFEKYHPGGFDYERHKELQQLAFELDERGAYVMITNANDKENEIEKENYVEKLYSEDVLPESFRKTTARGKRMINSDSTKRTNIGKTDIIVTNFSPFESQRTFEDFR